MRETHEPENVSTFVGFPIYRGYPHFVEIHGIVETHKCRNTFSLSWVSRMFVETHEVRRSEKSRKWLFCGFARRRKVHYPIEIIVFFAFMVFHKVSEEPRTCKKLLFSPSWFSTKYRKNHELAKNCKKRTLWVFTIVVRNHEGNTVHAFCPPPLHPSIMRRPPRVDRTQKN